MSKPKLQARMRALSFDDKVKVLEKLRDRSKVIAAAGLRKGDFMPRSKEHGQGTILAFSEDGTTFTELPALERFEKMSDVITRDAGIPTAVEIGDMVAIGRANPSTLGIAALHGWQQAMKTVFCRITFKDGDSILIKCLISYLKIEPHRFVLHLKHQS
jgi:hypothetical protein